LVKKKYRKGEKKKCKLGIEVKLRRNSKVNRCWIKVRKALRNRRVESGLYNHIQ
jgi:hypothetical protein